MESNKDREDRELLLSRSLDIPTATIQSECDDDSMWNLSRTILIYAAPLIFSNIVVTSNTFGEVLIMQHLGLEMVAASAYIESIKNFSLISSAAIFSALQPLISKEVSQSNYLEIGGLIQDTMLLGGCIGILIMVFLYFIENLLKLYIKNAVLLGLISNYFQPFIFGVPAFIAIEIIIQFWISSDMQNLIIPLNMLRAILQLSLSAFFVYGTPLNLMGLGLAATIQSWTVLALLLLYMGFSENFRKYQLFTWHPNTSSFPDRIKSNFKKILTIGSPACFQKATLLAAKILMTLLIGSISKDYLSAYYIAKQYSSWIVMIISSLATAGCVSLAKTNATSDFDKSKKICYVTLLLGIGLCLMALPLFCFMPKELVMLFNSNSSTHIIFCAKIIMPIIGLYNVFFALKHIAIGLYRGREETAFPAIAGLIGTIIGVVSSIVFQVIYNNAVGVVLSELGGVAITTLIFLMGLEYERRKINANKPGYTELRTVGFFSNKVTIEQRTSEISSCDRILSPLAPVAAPTQSEFSREYPMYGTLS